MKRYGFNFEWICYEDREPSPPDLKALDFLAEHGFDFVRIPVNYLTWTTDFDYFHPDESVFEYLDRYLAECSKRQIHMSLNMHRAPGYCINRPETEKHNLWTDEIAQDALVFLWEVFSRRYQGIPPSLLSFDLLNEPPKIGERSFNRDIHQRVIRRVFAAIRSIDPDRPIIIDGIEGGNVAVPELADLGAIHGGRGYRPHAISHWGAPWSPDWAGPEAPIYPGVVQNGITWNLDALREFYRPWREIQDHGNDIHIGEFGCYNQTPNDVALRWLTDILGLFHEYGWGFSMWNFEGPFGIVNHGREGASFEEVSGYLVDRDLLDLLQRSRRT